MLWNAISEAAHGDHALDTIVPPMSASKIPSAGIPISPVDEGLIALDEPIDAYLDHWADDKPGIAVAHPRGVARAVDLG